MSSDAPTAPTAARAPGELEPGRLVGRYLVVEELGRGGAGAVYSAFDPELDRKVALKVLAGPDTTDAMTEAPSWARFADEARLLARLSHPNVTSVFDVGVTEGRAYLALELVDGGDLATWIRETTPTERAPLAVPRMIAASLGVSAAHDAGVIHGDIKPANILVGTSGRICVTDFGVAQLRTGRGGAESTGDTRGATEGWGTPAYAAPEQLAGEQVDERIDVYGLSAALFEAVTGRLPFEGAGAELLENKRSQVPSWPAGVGPRWLVTLVDRGLAPDPARRPESVAAWRHELERGLGGARRRRLGASLVLGLGLVGGLGYALASPTPEDPCAVAADPVWTEAVAARTAVALEDTGVPYAAKTVRSVGQLLLERDDAVAAQRVSACRARADGLESEALYVQRGRCLDRQRWVGASLVEALQDADAATVDHAVQAAAGLPPVDECADAERLLAAVAPPSPETAADVDRLRADLDRAEVMRALGHTADALAEAERVAAEAPGVGFGPLIADARLLQGLVLDDARRFDEADAALREAFWAATAHEHDRVAAHAAIGLMRMAEQRMQPKEADVWAGTARAAEQRWGRDDVIRCDFHTAYAGHLLSRGDEGAEEAAREALAVVRRIRGEDDPKYAGVLVTVANYEIARGDAERGEALMRESVERYRELLGHDHPLALRPLLNLANAQAQRGAFDEAKAVIEEVRAVLEVVRAPELAATMHGLASMLANRDGDGAAALEHAERAVESARSYYGEGAVELSTPLYSLGAAQYQQAKYAAARASMQESLDILEAAGGPSTPTAVWRLVSLGNIALEERRLDAAEEVYRRAHELAEQTDQRRVMLTVGLGLGRISQEREQHDAALDWGRRTLEVTREFPLNHHEAAVAHLMIAEALVATEGDRTLASAHVASAREAAGRLAPAAAQPLLDQAAEVLGS